MVLGSAGTGVPTGRSRCATASFGALLAVCLLVLAPSVDARPRLAVTDPTSTWITAQLASDTVEVFDFAEVAVHVATPFEGNPFTGVEVTGTLTEVGAAPIAVPGFCDSDNGTLFRIRFLARRLGEHAITVRYAVPSRGIEWSWASSFQAEASGRKGIVTVDPDHPYHFLWSGTGQHFFYSGATAYHLLSWRDDAQMLALVSRMADAGANRIRFLNYGRASDNEWGGGMFQSHDFVWSVSPWVATDRERQLRDGSIGPDHTRFDLAHWKKAETLLRAMRDRDVVAAVNMYIDRGSSPEYGTDDAPPAGSDEENLYFRYAAARYGAFANVMWDLGTEHDEYRSSAWATEMGTRLREWDPYGHLVSAHPNQFRPEYQTQSWYGFSEFQYYGVEADAFGSDPLVRVNAHVRHFRDEVMQNGRILPQVEEEYGYERDPSGYDESDSQIRKKAWAIVLGGGYVTVGESTAWQHGDPTNGGRIEAATDILSATRIQREFFESWRIPYWEMEPMAELDGSGRFGLAKRGEHYVALLPNGGSVELALPSGSFVAAWMRPKTGQSLPVAGVARGVWRSPEAPPSVPGEEEDGDWILYLRRATTRQVDFAPSSTAPADDYERDAGQPFDPASGFGWLVASALPSRARACSDAAPEQSTFVFTTPERTWEMELENGDYDVVLSVGDCQYAQGPQRVTVEGTSFVDAESTGAGFFLVRSGRVRVLDGRLSVTIGGAGGTTALGYLQVTKPHEQPHVLQSIHFQTVTGRTPIGFVAQHGEPYDVGLGRGFSADLRGSVRSRGVQQDPALDGLVFTSTRRVTFETEVPDGTYDVQIAVGDVYAQGPHRVFVEGSPVFDGETTAANVFLVRRIRLHVADGRLSMEIGGTSGNTTVNYLTLASTQAEALAVDFGPESALPSPGFSADWGAPYDALRGYGWSRNLSGASRTRGRASDPSLDSFVFVGLNPATWKLDVPNGTYHVSVAVGDAVYPQGPQRVIVEGVGLVNGETTAPMQFLFRSAFVTVSDGQLTVEVGGLLGNTALDWVRVVAAP